MSLFRLPFSKKAKNQREYKELIRGLQHPETLLEAQKALVEIGEPAVPLLIKILKDKDSSLAAAEVLKEIGDPGIHHLIAALKDKEVSAYAAMVLEDIGQPSVEPLIESLVIPDRRVQILAIRSLGKLGDGRAVKPILTTLKRFILDDSVVEVAIEALERLDYRIGESDEVSLAVSINLARLKDLILDDERMEVATRELERVGYRIGESGEVSLDEFIKGIVQKGFEITPRGRSVYQNSKAPNYRFVVKERVVRLERKMVDKSRKWQRVRSFSIVHDLYLALAIADSLNVDIFNLEKSSISLKKPSVSSAAQSEFSSFAKKPVRITCAVVIGMIILTLIICRPFFPTDLEMLELFLALLLVSALVWLFTSIIVRKLHNKCPLCGGRVRFEQGPWRNDTASEFAICESCGTKGYTGVEWSRGYD
jgi:hypothetical protein